MTISHRSLFKSTSILMVSQLISWGLTLVLTLYLPRYLGVANIGKYQLGISLWAIVSILAQFGTSTYLTREIAQDHSRVNLLLSQSIIVMALLYILGIALLAIYLTFAHYAQDTIRVIAIFGVSALITLISTGFGATIQGLERVEYLGMAGIITNIVTTSASFIAIFLGASLNVIAWISSLGAFCSFGYLLISLHRITPFHFTLSFKHLNRFLTASFSFFLLNVFIVLYQQVDVVVISWILNEKGVGWYGISTRLTGSLMFIPTVFMTVFYPTFSRLRAESPAELEKLFRKAFNIMLLLGVAIGMGMYAIAIPLIKIIYGTEFANSGPILALRGLVSILTFENIILGIYLMAINRQKAWIFVMAAATIITIPLDLILVPYCQQLLNNGAMGGAYSYCITEMGMTIAGILLLPRKTLTLDTGWYALRALMAGSGMVAGIWWFRDTFILVQISVGAAIFLALTVLFNLITRAEWALLYGAISPIIYKLFKRTVRRTL